LVLIEAARLGNEKEVAEYSDVFTEHANKLVEVGSKHQNQPKTNNNEIILRAGCKPGLQHERKRRRRQNGALCRCTNRKPLPSSKYPAA
jgi:hypothetical protein